MNSSRLDVRYRADTTMMGEVDGRYDDSEIRATPVVAPVLGEAGATPRVEMDPEGMLLEIGAEMQLPGARPSAKEGRISLQVSPDDGGTGKFARLEMGGIGSGAQKALAKASLCYFHNGVGAFTELSADRLRLGLRASSPHVSGGYDFTRQSGRSALTTGWLVVCSSAIPHATLWNSLACRGGSSCCLGWVFFGPMLSGLSPWLQGKTGHLTYGAQAVLEDGARLVDSTLGFAYSVQPGRSVHRPAAVVSTTSWWCTLPACLTVLLDKPDRLPSSSFIA